MLKLQSVAVVAIHFRPAQPSAMICISRFALSATRFIPVSKRSSIPLARLINSNADLAANRPKSIKPRFILGAVLCLTLVSTPLFAASPCPLDKADETVHVDYIYDGDTVRLSDGRHVRFIGINTPEMARDQRPEEPLAAKAKAYLSQLLQDHHQQLVLRYDAQQYDHYGRLLAHGYLTDGRSIDSQLITAGLAAAIVVPPNVWHADCYFQLEATARQAMHGIWALQRYQGIDVRTLNKDATGFYRVNATVIAIDIQEKAWLITLDGPLTLKVATTDLSQFPPGTILALKNQRIAVRGWIYHSGQDKLMNLRHPLAVERLD